MTLDLQPIIVWITAALTIINFLTVIRTHLSGQTRETAAKVEMLEKRQIETNLKIQAIEKDIEHLPDRETTHRMEMAIGDILKRLEVQDATLSGKFAAMDERLKPIQAIGERLQDTLIEQARNAA